VGYWGRVSGTGLTEAILFENKTCCLKQWHIDPTTFNKGELGASVDSTMERDELVEGAHWTHHLREPNRERAEPN